MFQMDAEYNSISDAFYGAFHRPVWALALAWIIFACHKGYGGNNQYYIIIINSHYIYDLMKVLINTETLLF